MKKIFLLSLIFAFFAVGQCFAAGSCTISYGDMTKYTAEIIWTCTGDASDGTIPDTSSGSHSSRFREFPYAYRAWVENLSTDTDCTDNSDVYLYTTDSSGTKANDILNGQGVDQLDADTVNYIRLNQYDEIHGPVILDVNNQAEVSAVYRVTLVISK